MAELTDHDLLAEFIRTGAERAFATLVSRHINLVYSAARRFTSDDTLAEEITQAVFILLARKAGGISSRVILTGWLYQAARLTAANALKERNRRQQRESEACMQSNLITNQTDDAWKQLAPALDDAMGDLRETDRDAVLLRYFEDKPLAEVGIALGVSEDAARVRVNRAVDKLRLLLTKKGFTLGATAITGAVAANAVSAAPAALATTITAASLTGTTLTLTTIAMTTLQKIAVTTALTLSIGAGVYEAKQADDSRAETQKLQRQLAPFSARIDQLQAEDTQLSNLVAQAQDQKQLTQAQFNELIKLRGQRTVQQVNAGVESDPAFQKAQVWLAKEKKIRDQFDAHPEKKVPEMRFLTEEDWLDHARWADVDTAEGMRLAMCNIRNAAIGAFAGKLTQALGAYMATHQQQLPDAASDLAGYFHPPLTDASALLSRYVRATPDPDMTTPPMVFEQDPATLVDPIDSRVVTGTNTTIWLPSANPVPLPDELQPVAKAPCGSKWQRFFERLRS